MVEKSTDGKSGKPQAKITVEHTGGGGYEAPTISVDTGKGPVHPDSCFCKCASEAGSGGGSTSLD